MKRLWWGWVIFTLTVGTVGAQSCGLDFFRKPLSQKAIEKRENQIQSWITHHAPYNQLRSQVTLPVVVHILYRTPEQNISNDQVFSQIDVLNEDFRRLNADAQLTPDPFDVLAGDVELEFCLAKYETDSMVYDGIIRKQVTRENIGLSETFYKSGEGGSDLIDPERVINIYVCELGQGFLGFATVPNETGAFDGIIVQPQYFGRTGTASQSAPNDRGRTLTHEMGHYLGLEHLWGLQEGDCDEGDFVEDTPAQELPTYDCPNFPVRDICSPGRDGIMFNNYMDYTDDACMNFFTLGQKERMWAMINMYRSGLLDGMPCSGVTTQDPTSSNSAPVSLLYNPYLHQICIEGTYSSNQQILRIYSLDGVLLHQIFGPNSCENIPLHHNGLLMATLYSGSERLNSIIFAPAKR